MRTVIFLFFVLIMYATVAKAQTPPPVSIKGQNSVNKLLPKWNLQVPNSQATNLNGIDALIETGNANILENPGFEAAEYDFGWVVISGTTTEETTEVFSGVKSMKIVASSSPVQVFNSSPIGSSAFADGVQLLGYMRVKTDTTGLKVCSRVEFTTSTTNCVDVQANNKWGLYKVPFIGGNFYHGIVLTSQGNNVSGTTYVDDAFVGAVDLSATQSFDTTCDTIACATEFSVKVGSTGTVGDENLDWISTCSVTSPTTTCNFNAGVFTVTPNCVATPQSTSTEIRISGQTSSAISFQTYFSNGSNSVTGLNFTCQKQGADYAAAIAAQKAFQKSKISSYSSTNADFGWTDYTPTVSNLGAGSGTVIGKYKRQGDSALINIRFFKDATSGTGASNVGFTLPPGLSVDSAKINGSSFAGVGYSSAPTVAASNMVSFWNNTSQRIELTNANNTVTGSQVVATSELQATITLPIQGWQNSNIIIGQFNGLESCTNTLECTDTFSAKVSSSGVVSGENVDWINGNCTFSAGAAICTFNNNIFTVAPNCVSSTVYTTGTGAFTFNTSASTTVASISTLDANNTVKNEAFNLICQKQGADYIGKTAKAVASDQNVRSIGSTNVDIQSVYFGSGASCTTACSTGTCTVCNQVGGKITSVTWTSGGNYRLNGIDGTKYNCQGSGFNGSNVLPFLHNRNASTSSYSSMEGGGAAMSLSSVTCIGIP